MIADAQRIGNGRQRRIHRADAGKETRVHDVEIVEFVRLAVHVQHRIVRVGAEPAGAGLMRDTGDGNFFPEIKIIGNEVRMQVQMFEHGLQLLAQPVERIEIAEFVVEPDFTPGIQGDAVLRPRQILAGQPEIHRVPRYPVEREARREFQRVILEHRSLGFAEHLDVAQRKFIIRRAQIKIIDRQCFLEPGRIFTPGKRDQRDGVVKHVMPSDQVRTVGQTARMFCAGGQQQQPGGVGRAAGDDDEAAGEFLALSGAFDDHPGDFASAGAGFKPLDPRIGQQAYVRIFQRGPDRNDFGIGFGVNQAREAVAGVATNATAMSHVRLVQQDAGRRIRRAITRALQAVGQFLDARLVADGRERIRRAGRWFGGIVAASAVDMVEPFRLRVIRFQILITDGPVGRHAVGGAVCDEILLPQPEQGCAIHLGGAADEIVRARLERLFVLVIPGVLGHVAVLHEYFRGIPIRLFARQIIAPFEDENALAGRGQSEGQRAAAGAAADDNNVVMVHVNLRFMVRQAETGLLRG